MGKETRIGVGVVGVLVAISGALLYGRLTRDTGLPIELNVDSGAATSQNDVPKQPTIQRPTGAIQAHRPTSPAPLRQDDGNSGRSYLLDTNQRPMPDSVRDITLPDYRSPATRHRSPAIHGGSPSLVSPATASSSTESDDRIRVSSRNGEGNER